VDVFLFISVLRMKPEVVCLCLMYGARINAVDINGHTPLYIAAVRCGDASMVHLLLALGANSAITFGRRRRESLLVACARTGRVKVVRAVLASKTVNLNQQSMEGTTALSVACRHGHVEVAKALLFAGADASLENYRSATARDVAHLWGWQNCVDLLDVSVLNDTIDSPPVYHRYL
jgi:ankyrin repeat protein